VREFSRGGGSALFVAGQSGPYLHFVSTFDLPRESLFYSPTILEYMDRARPGSSVPLTIARPSLNNVISYGGEEHFKRKSLNWDGPKAAIDLESSSKFRSPFTPGMS